MLSLGVLGYGYWGPNIVRNFQTTPGCSVKWVCDVSPKSLERAKKAHPGIEVTSNPKDVLTCPNTDAVAIVTPVALHYPLAKNALENGKHIFVEKPFTLTSAQAEELIEIAERKNLKIMVDHTFVFTSAVRKIKDLIDENVLGDLYYYDSTRVNLGLFQSDVNVIWDLAPHDLSIVQYILNKKPAAVAATGERHVNGHEDIAYLTVYFPGNVIAHFNVNWLSPVKVRMTLIGGEKKMLVWNDLEVDEKIKIYDKGITKGNGRVKADGQGLYDLLVSYRMGDIWAPRLEQVEALKVETQYFVDCIAKNETPMNDGRSGLDVVRMLEAADKSLQQKGGIVYL
jgi:predicted dehydrogenase